jgi:hypothetical protein
MGLTALAVHDLATSCVRAIGRPSPHLARKCFLGVASSMTNKMDIWPTDRVAA